MFKITRYSDTIKLFAQVIKSKQEEIVIAMFIDLILFVTSASLMYFTKHQAQPENFPHIPAVMWWGIITLKTVGYGDIYPITSNSRF
nr:ion transporter [Okeania sp. SIO3I5]